MATLGSNLGISWRYKIQYIKRPLQFLQEVYTISFKLTLNCYKLFIFYGLSFIP